jgi:NTE family protein
VLAFMRRSDEPPRKRRTGDGSDGAPKARVGLVLGAGAARGWTHIGVLRECLDQGLMPEAIVGTSIGAVVGGCFAAGKLAEIEAFARGLTRRSVLSMMDISFGGGGLLGGNRLRRRLESELGERRIEDLPIRFAAVATEIGTGHEIWLKRGGLSDAIRASYSLPGIFEPVQLYGRWLFDGALVNPVPVTACRAFGVDVVVAINLAESLGRGTVIQDDGPAARELIEAAASELQEVQAAARPGALRGLMHGLGGPAAFVRRQFARPANGGPGVGSVMVEAFNIVQDRIARARLAGDPPDVMITPRLGKIGLFDFHRADEMIAIGRDAVRKAMNEIREIIEPGVGAA